MSVFAGLDTESALTRSKRDALYQLPSARMLMRLPHFGRSIHHAQHRKASCIEESPNQQTRDNEKGDVEPSRVGPRDRGINHAASHCAESRLTIAGHIGRLRRDGG